MKLLLLFLSITALNNAADISDLIDGNVKLAKALYADSVSTQVNSGWLITRSPLSVEIIMALIHSGAKGATAEEISTGIFLPEDTDGAMESALSAVPFNVSTIIFSSSAAALTEEFENTASTVYHTIMEDMDFINGEEAADILNGWIKNQGGNNMFFTDDLNKDTESALINNIYMEMNWANQFPVNQTYVGRYTGYVGADNEMVNVSVLMMTQEPALFNYYASEELDAQFLEVPFENHNVTMTIVLPNTWNGLLELEQQLDAIFSTPDYTQEVVKFSLPSYTMGVVHEPLYSTIKSFGIETAFTTSADFSGMANDPGEIMVRHVMHGCEIKFMEEGVAIAMDTAATTQWSNSQSFKPNHDAVTKRESPKARSVESKPVRPTSESSDVLELLGDHPFFFYVKYNGLIIFMGRQIM